MLILVLSTFKIKKKTTKPYLSCLKLHHSAVAAAAADGWRWISKRQYILNEFPPDSQSSLTNEEMEGTITDCSKTTEEEHEEAVSCKEWLLLKRLYVCNACACVVSLPC